MKYSLIGIGAVLLLWIGIVVIYGTQINTVYLCSTATEISETVLESSSIANKDQYISDRLFSVIFSPKLSKLFTEIQQMDFEIRRDGLALGLQKIMGSDYQCPALENLVANLPAP